MENAILSIEYCGIKEEFGEDVKFNVEDLHRSINIKKETPSDPDGESEKAVLTKDHCDIKKEVMENKELNCEDLQYSVDSKEDASVESEVLCEVCNEKFTSNSQLVTHSKIHSVDLIAKLKNRLKIHLSAGTGDKSFPCELGDDNSAQKASSGKNGRVHGGEKQFACKLCAYKCFIKQSMTRHMISHTGEKPFFCEICDYKCSIKQYLKKHMKTHSREKPFACAICQFKCAHKDSLRSHLKVHTSKRRVFSIP